MTDNTFKNVTVTRDELYRQVWETPMSTLSKRYGLSDVGLAKLCRRHNIPRPPVGYWQKREVGKAPLQPPLPECSDPHAQKITFCTPPRREEPPPKQPPAYDDDILQLLALARGLPQVKVVNTLRGLHRLVRNTWDGLEGCSLPRCGLLRSVGLGLEVLDVEVSRPQIRRALCLLNALVRTIERLGGKVSGMVDSCGIGTMVSFAGERVPFSLRERCGRRTVEDDTGRAGQSRYDIIPNGRLRIEAGRSYEDTDKRKLEDRVNEIVAGFIAHAGDARLHRRYEEAARGKREEEAKRRQEEERLRLEREQELNRQEQERQRELARRKQELEAKKRAEHNRVERLIQEADAWHHSRILRGYIRAVRQMILREDGAIEHGSETEVWLNWATAQADRMDPLAASPPSVLDEQV